MKKLIIGSLVAATILAVSAPAFAGWYDVFGYYHGCGWFNGFFGPEYLCYP